MRRTKATAALSEALRAGRKLAAGSPERIALERVAWTHTHRDFRGKAPDGTRTALYYNPGTGSELRPMSAIPQADLLRRLPSTLRHELTGHEA